jgi:hypothetical protein
MQPDSERPRFDLFQFQTKMREARGAGIPIRPPAWPVFAKPKDLASLIYLQSLHGETVYKSLVKEEDEEKKRRWEPPFLFAHRI